MECLVSNKIGLLVIYYLAWMTPVLATLISGQTGHLSNNNPSVILSKLSDAELIKLLNKQTNKNDYNVKDVASLIANMNEHRSAAEGGGGGGARFKVVSNQDRGDDGPHFRLENKPVVPNAESKDDYTALMKLSEILNNNQPQQTDSDGEADADRELLFDVLVSQLKALCFRRPKKHKVEKVNSLMELLKAQSSKESDTEVEKQTESGPKEHVFLILNDELNARAQSDELVFVDPDSLAKNSSVLILGSLGDSLSNREVKSVMDRVTEEIHKPSYFSMLKELSSISPSDSKNLLMKNFVIGPQSRRYVKPHRCNYQSPLARMHGGPRWIICTGYLNLNTPSIYD